jgi:zinc protease
MSHRLDAILPPASVKRTRLANGLTVLARRDCTAPVVAIVTWVRAGYFDEPDDVVGIAHVLEHMYFKGTPTHGVGEIARATKAAGGYLNAGTIYDHTHYYAVLPSEGFARGLEVQADAFANSVIDAGELSRELEVIIEETKRKADTPSALAVETLFELLHDRHRIRRWRMGREGALRKLTRAQVLGFYRNFYRPANTVLAIVGDVDPDEALAHAARLYGGLPAAPVARSLSPVDDAKPGFRTREWEGDIQQAELLFGWRTPALAHPDSPALDLLGTVLAGGRASRLVRAARDRRLVSSVGAYDYTPTELGVFVVHALTRPDTMREAAEVLWDQLRRVRDGAIAPAEVERARCLVEAQWLRRLETAEGQANFIGAWELQGGWESGTAYHESLFNADARTLARVAREWLDPSQASVLAYRPRGTAPLGPDSDGVWRLLDGARPKEIDPAEAPVAAPAVVRRGARLERVHNDVHCFRSESGLPILVRRRAGAALVHLGCFISGGVVGEGVENGGITTMMARSMLRGTGRRSASRLSEDAELLGGTPAANVGTEAMQWSLGVPARSFDSAVELLADLILDPAYPADGVEAERTVALAALASLRDDMYRQPLRLAARLAWPGHPYGRSTLGTEESVRSLKIEDLRAWHARHLRAAPGVLAVVGDLDPQEAADVLASRFSALAYAPPVAVTPPTWPVAASQKVEEREKAQTALAMLFEGPTRRDAARFDASLLAGVASGLGGRLFEELRDRQSLAYTVLVRHFPRMESGALVAYIATSPAKEVQAREGLLRELARFAESDVTEEELDRARTYAIGTWRIEQSSGGAVLAELVDAWLHGTLEELRSYPEDLGAVTATRIRDLARRYLDVSRRAEGIVRGRAG